MTSAIFARAASEWQDMRTDFERHVSAAYDRALEETGGVLVNNAGRAAGVDGWDLFTGPRVQAERFASWELLEHWQATPRLSLAEFERRWLSGGAA